MSEHKGMSGGRSGGRMYVLLAVALVVSFIVMYLLTFAMINRTEDFYLNLSNAYMALMMVFAMGIVMIAVMWRMYPGAGLKVGLLVGFAALFAAAFLVGRAEAFIGDEQFLKSMIPHHSRAILVCEQSDITDPEIVALCGEIVESQQREIDQMRAILERMRESP